MYGGGTKKKKNVDARSWNMRRKRHYTVPVIHVLFLGILGVNKELTYNSSLEH